jgi:phosphoribosyl-AMP cyclohydrolase
MENRYFRSIENCAQGTEFALDTLLAQLSFNRDGLLPVIAQDHVSREVLMMAWMNREALEHTLASGNVTYWSRSRAQLWRKGETSGNHQRLIKLRIDCDGDTLLCDVEQVGPACHTGRSNCFYLSVDRHKNSVTLDGE